MSYQKSALVPPYTDCWMLLIEMVLGLPLEDWDGRNQTEPTCFSASKLFLSPSKSAVKIGFQGSPRARRKPKEAELSGDGKDPKSNSHYDWSRSEEADARWVWLPEDSGHCHEGDAQCSEIAPWERKMDSIWNQNFWAKSRLWYFMDMWTKHKLFHLFEDQFYEL